MIDRKPWLALTALAIGLAVAVATAPSVGASDRQLKSNLQQDGSAAIGGVAQASEPVANCTVSETTALVGEPVVLDASASEDADEFQYDRLGDGEFGDFVDSETNTIVYDIPGSYAPRVKVWQYPNETTDTARCGTLRVVEPSLSLSVDADPAEPSPAELVQFTPDLSGAFERPVIYQWDWTNDDTVDLETDTNETVGREFDEPGTYTVRVEATSAGGATATANVTVTVQRPADAPPAFTATPATGDQRGLVALTANPDAIETDAAIQEVEWAVDGERVAAGERITLALADESTHEVSVTFLDSNGERWTVSRTVSRRSLLGTTFSVTPSTPRVGEVISLRVPHPIDGREYGWDVGNDSEIDAFGRSMTVQFEDPGTHEIRLVAESGDGRQVATRSIEVDPAPEGSESEQATGIEIWHSPANPKEGEVVRLGVDVMASDLEDVAVAWDLDDDGEPEADGRSVLAAFNETGRQTVAVTVTYPNGTRMQFDQSVSVGVQSAADTRLDRETTPGETTTTTESGDGPGFGVVAAVVGLILGLLAARGGRR